MRYESQQNLVPLAKRGPMNHTPQRYGTSVRGLPLEVYGPADQPADILIITTMHGDESDGTVVLSEAMRTVDPQDFKHPVVLCVNPDGTLQGTRCNANGVDLNRNLPTANWSAQSLLYRGHGQRERAIELSTGSSPGSEPENKALLELIARVQPKTIVSLHGPIGCVEDPEFTPLAKWVAQETGLPLVENIGYETPGSFGTWCAEHNIHIITWEFPVEPITQIIDSHAPVLRRLITGHDLPELA
ncbi:MAG: murein tripeptide amidase MpaA [Planctomycetota bacterium]